MKKLLALVFGLCIAISSIVASVGLVVFFKPFYLQTYEELDLAKKENISQQDLESAIFLMVDYVQGNRDDLTGTIQWKNGQQEMFNQKEKTHMKDVKALWQKAWLVMWISLSLALCIALFFMVEERPHWLSWLCKGIVQAWAMLAVLIVFIGFWMWIDFTGLWTQFHHIFFTNDLWLLDPATDFMIVICPEALFFKMILYIGMVFGAISIVLLGFSMWWLKKKAVIGFESL